MSAVQLADPKFPTMVTAALASAGLPPERLILEITETAFVTLDVSLPVLRGLSASGVRLAIDDFGTGHASLNQLARLPFDIIKVDRSFVTRLSDDRTAALVETIVSLASRFGATAVAEGIEKDEQRAQLLTMGCRVAATEIPDGVSIDEWVDAAVVKYLPAGCYVPRSQQAPITIDGQSGRISEDCPHKVVATVVSGGRLYLFVLFSDRSDARAFFDAWVDTIDLRLEETAIP